MDDKIINKTIPLMTYKNDSVNIEIKNVKEKRYKALSLK